ncbi:permease prefix domain 1-containing protein [Actinomadura macrotermitis]|uniref:Uncharacterized protein n=1 Tax=Actinomadura macrotermitis TaxID=2585200 RepID=A0A7K0BU44_9ACTN|nr:permease prefix domain 1-containing protein [Actinomadura macrotermitis]MQY04214.1 hypothetical protein [Actinomadura macrotermitis]
MTAPIEAHVAALEAVLRGPARAKARMLREARDGLADAAEALEGEGLPADQAARRAVGDFGPVDEVAPAFQQELTIVQARHTARVVVLVVPCLLACWRLAGEGRALQVTAAHLGGVAAAAALLAAAALAATGVLARRLPTPRHLPIMVAWAGTAAGAALGAGALALVAASVLAADWPVTAALAALTLVFHTRVAASARACRRCARPAVTPGRSAGR